MTDRGLVRRFISVSENNPTHNGSGSRREFLRTLAVDGDRSGSGVGGG